jgi:hypothetical protein
MERSIFVKAVLLISGLIGVGVGTAQLFVPVMFEASAGIQLGEDISLLSEIRAAGGALLVGGIMMMAGAFVSKLTLISMLLSSLFFLAYGFSRLLAMLVDGIPNPSLVAATAVEMIIGLLALTLLIHFRRKQPALSKA